MNQKIQRINLLKDSIERHRNVASQSLEELFIEFSKQNLDVNQIENNELKFECLGLKFITRPEIAFNSLQQRFDSGKLSTYLVMKEVEDKLIVSYEFDSIGNINGIHLVKEFAIYYYADFFNNLINYSIENNLSFHIR